MPIPVRDLISLGGPVHPFKHFLVPILAGVFGVVSLQIGIIGHPVARGPWVVVSGFGVAGFFFYVLVRTAQETGNFTTSAFMQSKTGIALRVSLFLGGSGLILVAAYAALFLLLADFGYRTAWFGLIPPLHGLSLAVATWVGIAVLPALTAREVMDTRFPDKGDVIQKFQETTASNLEANSVKIPRIGCLLREEVDPLLDVLPEDRRILLTGEGGAGKSGVLSILARRWDHRVLFLDASRHGGVTQLHDLDVAVAYDKGSLTRQIRQVAASDKLLLLLDQLDSVNHQTLTVFLRLADYVRQNPNVHLVGSTRKEDLKHNTELRDLSTRGFDEIEFSKLNHETAKTLLDTLGMPHPAPEIVNLARRPFYLSLVAELSDEATDLEGIGGEVAIWEALREALHRRHHPSDGRLTGQRVVATAARWAKAVVEGDTGTIDASKVNPWIPQQLKALGVLVPSHPDNPRRVAFRHEKLQLYFYVWDAVQNKRPLAEIRERVDVRGRPQVWTWLGFLARDVPDYLHEIVDDALGEGGLPFYPASKVMDQLRHLDVSRMEKVRKTAVAAINDNEDLRINFLREPTHPSWLRPFFDKRRINDDGHDWLIMSYLRDMASRNPDGVQEALQEIEENELPDHRAFHSFLSVVDELPSKNMSELIPHTGNLIEASDVRDGREQGLRMAFTRARSIIEISVEEEEDEKALHLLRTLLMPAQREDTRYIDLRISQHDYSKIFEIVTEPLVRREPIRLIELLEESLRDAISLKAEHRERDPSTFPISRRSGLWQIRDKDLDLLGSGERVLLSTLVSTIEAWLEGTPELDQVTDLVDRYRGDWLVFQKIGLHILRKTSADVLDVVKEELTSAENYREYALQKDLMALLRDRFGELSSGDQERVLEVIDSVPPEDTLRSNAESYDGDVDDLSGLGDRWVAEWKRDHLGLIREDLTHEYRATLTELEDTWGEFRDPLEPDFSTARPSHLPEDQEVLDSIEGMESEDIVDYLLDLVEDEFEDEREPPDFYLYGRIAEQADKVFDLVLQAPDDYVDILQDLLDFPPSFVQRWFRTLRQQLGGETGGTPPQLVLEATISLANEVADDPETHPQPVRLACCQFLRALVLQRGSELGEDPSGNVRSLLLELAQDPDPKPSGQPSLDEFDQQSPSEVAAFSVRPTAIRGLLELEQQQAPRDDEGSIHPDYSLSEDLEEVVRRAAASDSLADAAALGMVFVNLWTLDAELARRISTDLFPTNGTTKSDEKLLTSWGAYTETSRLHAPIYNHLYHAYERGLLLLGERLTDETTHHLRQGAGPHIAVAYLAGETDIDNPDSLVQLLFNQGNKRLNRAFAWALWKAASEQPDELQRWSRLRALWQARLDEVPSVMEHADEFVEYSRWLQLLEEPPTIEETKTLLRQSVPAFLKGSIWRNRIEEYLAAAATDDPEAVLDVYEPWTRGALEEGIRWPLKDPSRTIITECVNAGGEVRDRTIRLAEEWMRAGYTDVEDLLDDLL